VGEEMVVAYLKLWCRLRKIVEIPSQHSHYASRINPVIFHIHLCSFTATPTCSWYR